MELDDALFYEGRATLAVAANGRVYGGGFQAAPRAEVTDGLLDVAVAKGMSRLTVTTFVGRYKSGRHEGLNRLLKTGRAKTSAHIVAEAFRYVRGRRDGDGKHLHGRGNACRAAFYSACYRRDERAATRT